MTIWENLGSVTWETLDDLPESQRSLSAYVKASDRDQEFVQACEARARAIVASRVGSAEVPPVIIWGAVLEVGANLYQRRVSLMGTSNYNDPELAVPGMRPALDPMTPAWPLLRPYLGPGLA